MDQPPEVARSLAIRAVWFSVGCVAVGLGTLGMVVPGLPTTVFFIVAASCFARSSPRFERWVLDLPGVGRMVRDHRAGLGMPRGAKAIAISMMMIIGGVSVVTIDVLWVRVVVAALIVIGIAYVAWRVPTREFADASMPAKF